MNNINKVHLRINKNKYHLIQLSDDRIHLIRDREICNVCRHQWARERWKRNHTHVYALYPVHNTCLHI